MRSISSIWRPQPPPYAPSAACVPSPKVTRQLVELAEHARLELDLGGGERVVELVRAAGADDGRRDRRVVHDPGHGECRRLEAGCFGDLQECIHRLELAVVPVAILVHRTRVRDGEARSRGRLATPLVLARQQPAGERVVWDDADAFFETERKELAFELAEQKVVARLHGVEPRERQRLAAAERAGHAVGEKVRTPDVANLA